MLDFEERKQLLKKSIEKGDIPINIDCTGVPPNKIRNVRKALCAEIYDNKAKKWRKMELIEYLDTCPICGKLMKVIAIPGTSWLAACSEEHTAQTIKELEKGWYDTKAVQRQEIDSHTEYI